MPTFCMNVAHRAKVSMDYFHMLKAVAMQHSLLIHRHLQTAMHEIRRLADVPHRFHLRAKQAMLREWESRGAGWAKFREYFEVNFLNRLTGWWGEYLGQGTPRTTGGCEGGGRQCTKCWEAGTVLRKPWSVLSTLF